MKFNRRFADLAPRRRLLFALSAVVLVAAIAVAISAAAASGAFAGFSSGKLGAPGASSVTGNNGSPPCGVPDQPPCPTRGDSWVTVSSESPAAVLAAIRSCPDYMSPTQAFTFPAGSTFSFDAPVLVLPATTNNAQYQYNLPYFMVRVAVNGVRSVTYTVLYDPARHRLRLAGIGRMTPTDPGYNKPFPWNGVSSA